MIPSWSEFGFTDWDIFGWGVWDDFLMFPAGDAGYVGFVKINWSFISSSGTLMNTGTMNVRLDGKQSASIFVRLEDDAGELIRRDVSVNVRGLLKFSGPDEDETDIAEQSQTDTVQKNALSIFKQSSAVYPVLFVRNNLTIQNGTGIITLLPRSEDIIDEAETIIARAGVDTSIGQSQVLQLKQNAIKIEADKIREPYKVSVEITINDSYLYGQTIDNYQVPETTGDEIVPGVLSQTANPILNYYSDISWIPIVDPVLETNSSDADEVLVELENMRNRVSFGASAIYDAMVQSAGIISDNTVHSVKKMMYLFTDNDANMSNNTVDDAIAAVNQVEGNKEVPVVIGNFSVVYPMTLSTKADTSDTTALNKMAFMTGGQSLTVVSQNDLVDLIDLFYGSAVGSMGYGTAQFVIDLGSTVMVDYIYVCGVLYPDTNIDWKVYFSTDGYNFTTSSDTYAINREIDFSNTYARYLKFVATLVTGFGSGTDIYYGDDLVRSPVLQYLRMQYNGERKAYIYFNEVQDTVLPQQIAVAVDANSGTDVLPDQVKVGFATSDSHNWQDFYSSAQPRVNQNGKVLIPVRFVDDVNEHPRDILERINCYTYKSHYGRFDPLATVIVYDIDDQEVPSNTYKVYPRDGIVVFASPQRSTFTVNVINQNHFRMGMELTNKSSVNPLEIHGLGYFYNTNMDLLPPVQEIPPSATEVEVVPSDPVIYSTIQGSYKYTDANLDKEDTTKTQIRWYINGLHINYLDGCKKWNDLTNPADPIFSNVFDFGIGDIPSGMTVEQYARQKGESILHVGDKVYFTVKPSDGTMFGNLVQSSISEVKETIPAATSVSIKGMDTDGAMYDVLRSNMAAKIVYTFTADVATDKTQVIWYVNDEEFKNRVIGQTYDDGAVADQVIPGEVNAKGVVALVLNNTLYAKVIPKTDTSIGQAVITDTVSVVNSLPTVENVTITPSNPKQGDDLNLYYDFYDFDIFGLADPGQSNNTSVVWYKFDASVDPLNYTIVTDPSFTTNQLVIPGSMTTRGHRWKAVVTPNDAIDNGVPVTSNVVIIG